MRKLFAFLLVTFFWGCYQDYRPEKPSDLLSEQQMSDILYDVYIINAAKGTNRKVLEQRGVDPEKIIFEKYDIDSLQFAMSNDYYAYDIEKYEAIVQAVKDRLDSEKEFLRKKQEQEDSIRVKSLDTIKSKSLQVKFRDSIQRGIPRRPQLRDSSKQNQ